MITHRLTNPSDDSSGSFAEHGVQNGLPSRSNVAELHDLDALEVIWKIGSHPWLHSHDIGTMTKKRAK